MKFQEPYMFGNVQTLTVQIQICSVTILGYSIFVIMPKPVSLGYSANAQPVGLLALPAVQLQQSFSVLCFLKSPIGIFPQGVYPSTRKWLQCWCSRNPANQPTTRFTWNLWGGSISVGTLNLLGDTKTYIRGKKTYGYFKIVDHQHLECKWSEYSYIINGGSSLLSLSLLTPVH